MQETIHQVEETAEAAAATAAAPKVQMLLLELKQLAGRCRTSVGG
jgi:hypothetical protein